MGPTPSRAGKGLMAVAGSLWVWGLGHLLAGRNRRAATWFVAWLILSVAVVTSAAVPTLLPALVVLVPVELILGLWLLIDAFLVARSSPRPMLGSPVRRYLAAAALLAGALFANPGAWVAGYMRNHWVQAFRQPSVSSMAPTLVQNDRFLVHKRAWTVRRWDIVVFDAPEVAGTRYVSRIAGLPGEKIEIIDKTLFVNGSPTDPPPGAGPYVGRLEKYFLGGNGVEGAPMTLGPDEYFVLGDNSPRAADSRYWREAVAGHQPGALPRGNIIGRVTAIYWPVGRWRRFE